jgi:hypothetical protein
MVEDCGSLSDPSSQAERLAFALEAAEGLAKYARAERLTQADELLSEFVALLVTCNAGCRGDE